MNEFTKKLYMASLRYRIQMIIAFIIAECIAFYYMYITYIKDGYVTGSYIYLLVHSIFTIGLVGIVGMFGFYFYFTSIRLNGSICIVKKGFRTIKIEDFTVTKKGAFSLWGDIITVYIISGRTSEQKVYHFSGEVEIYLDELSDGEINQKNKK